MIVRVDGLPGGASEDGVRSAFERFGAIDKVALLVQRDERVGDDMVDGDGEACAATTALITFNVDEAARLCLSTTPSELGGGGAVRVGLVPVQANLLRATLRSLHRWQGCAALSGQQNGPAGSRHAGSPGCQEGERGVAEIFVNEAQREEFYAVVDRYWKVLSRSGASTLGGASFTTYRKLHVRITRSLAPNCTHNQELRIATEDWEADCAAAGEQMFLTESGLAMALLELALLWAESSLDEAVECKGSPDHHNYGIPAGEDQRVMQASEANEVVHAACLAAAVGPFLSAIFDNITEERLLWIKQGSEFTVMSSLSFSHTTRVHMKAGLHIPRQPGLKSARPPCSGRGRGRRGRDRADDGAAAQDACGDQEAQAGRHPRHHRRDDDGLRWQRR